MSDNDKWSVFPNHKDDDTPQQKKEAKNILNLKIKSLILVISNLLLIAVYLYANRDVSVLERIVYGFTSMELPVLFEMLVFSIFIILTLTGLVLWIYFFLKDSIHPADRQKESHLLRSWYETKFDVDVVIIIAVIIRLIIQPFSVFGSSMEPNFHGQEYIIVNEMDYRLHQPQRGDVIVFKYPLNKNKNYIKRIIGLPGERVVIKDNEVWIYNDQYRSGVELQESYIPSSAKTEPRNNEFTDITLKSNEYYVLGDNRGASSDSREWGTVASDLIIGKSWVVCWPIDDWKVITVPTYNYNTSSNYLWNGSFVFKGI